MEVAARRFGVARTGAVGSTTRTRALSALRCAANSHGRRLAHAPAPRRAGTRVVGFALALAVQLRVHALEHVPLAMQEMAAQLFQHRHTVRAPQFQDVAIQQFTQARAGQDQALLDALGLAHHLRHRLLEHRLELDLAVDDEGRERGVPLHVGAAEVSGKRVVVQLEQLAQLGGEALRKLQILHAQRPAGDLVFVGRADAAARGADLAGPGPGFAGLVEIAVQGPEARDRLATFAPEVAAILLTDGRAAGVQGPAPFQAGVIAGSAPR